MAKYRDTRGMGKSKICPYKKGEDKSERHFRRKNYNLKEAEEISKFCMDYLGVSLFIRNRGHHWQVFYGNKVLEWWPSSAKVVYNKNYQHGIHCHDYKQFIKLIKKYFKKGHHNGE